MAEFSPSTIRPSRLNPPILPLLSVDILVPCPHYPPVHRILTQGLVRNKTVLVYPYSVHYKISASVYCIDMQFPSCVRRHNPSRVQS